MSATEILTATSRRNGTETNHSRPNNETFVSNQCFYGRTRDTHIASIEDGSRRAFFPRAAKLGRGLPDNLGPVRVLGASRVIVLCDAC